MTKFSPLEAHFAAQRALEHLHLFIAGLINPAFIILHYRVTVLDGS